MSWQLCNMWKRHDTRWIRRLIPKNHFQIFNLHRLFPYITIYTRDPASSFTSKASKHGTICFVRTFRYMRCRPLEENVLDRNAQFQFNPTAQNWNWGLLCLFITPAFVIAHFNWEINIILFGHKLSYATSIIPLIQIILLWYDNNLKVKVSSYIVQYPVLMTTQSASHFTPWQNYLMRHISTSLGSIPPRCN